MSVKRVPPSPVKTKSNALGVDKSKLIKTYTIFWKKRNVGFCIQVALQVALTLSLH